MSYPDLRRSVTGHWPPRISDVPAGVPVLGEHLYGPRGKGLVLGWVQPPADGTWSPADLLWTPPGSRSLDRLGEIVDAVVYPGTPSAWVTAQLAKRDQYLELLRSRVLAGSMKLTASLARMLGMRWDDGVRLDARAVDERAPASAGGTKASDTLDALRQVGAPVPDAVLREAAREQFARFRRMGR